jgi:hypothetical protein
MDWQKKSTDRLDKRFIIGGVCHRNFLMGKGDSLHQNCLLSGGLDKMLLWSGVLIRSTRAGGWFGSPPNGLPLLQKEKRKTNSMGGQAFIAFAKGTAK